MPRWADVMIAAAVLTVLAPLLALISLAIAVSSRGPVLFRQVRMGRDAELFVLLKFRTMQPGSDRGGRLTIGAGDPRVTAIGRWLRATKLDELPQLINVVRGDMALVGPRPEVPEYRLRDCPAQDVTLAARPGLTDPASICFRDEVDLLAAQDDPDRYYRTVLLPAKCELSADYLRRRTPGADVAVLVLTAVAVLRGGSWAGPNGPTGNPIGGVPA
ncbi:MAG TPA: sugar transferase [Egicoccus sp.]|nr:sugar transferase [Egicoccus sp.]HSK21696.1 sugar transferase [Egicoccus sp.]